MHQNVLKVNPYSSRCYYPAPECVASPLSQKNVEIDRILLALFELTQKLTYFEAVVI